MRNGPGAIGDTAPAALARCSVHHVSEAVVTSTGDPGAQERDEPARLRRRPALAHVSNQAVQEAARGGVPPASLLAGLGNQAVLRALGVYRHPGKDALKDGHKASDHQDEPDQREHARLEQGDFDKDDSKAFFTKMEKLAPSMEIDLDKLPGKLQALIRQIQSQITALEIAFFTPLNQGEMQADRDKALQGRIATGARSWHDDTNGLVPAPKNDATSSPRAAFFANWRKGDKSTGKDVPTKQEKNLAKLGSTGGKYPFREYTAVGWLEGHQNGRLIYDPFDDVFYLSLFHYKDKAYFRINAPRDGGGGAAAASMSEWDLDLVLYQAYQEVSAEVAAAAARKAEVKEGKGKPEKSRPDALLAAMAPDVQRYLGVLHDLRTSYATRYDDARAEVERIWAASQADKRRAELTAKAQTQSKGSRGKKESPEEAEAREKQEKEEKKKIKVDLPFMAFNHEFWVNSEKGFIGFKRAGKLTLPNYKDATTIGDIAILFRQCVEADAIGDEENTALMLAALLAEPSRHPVAALEALLAVIQSSPLPGGEKAFGHMLPMAAGGTIGTGGIALDVMLREARIGTEVIMALLAKHLELKKEEVEAYLFDLAAGGDLTLVTKTVKEWLFAALMTPARQARGFKPVGEMFAKRREDAAEAAEAAAATETQTKAEEPVSQNGAPPQEIVREVPDEFPEHLRELAVDGAGAQPLHSIWTLQAANYQGPPGSPDGTLSPQQVLVQMRDSRGYEDYTSFWVAYDVFRHENPQAQYELSPIQVINYIQRRSPTALFVMRMEDWDEYDKFKQEHPEFVYPR